MCVSEFHPRVGLRLSFVSLGRGLPRSCRLRSARPWSRSHALHTRMAPGPTFRGDACGLLRFVAKHAQQARRARRRVVRATDETDVCSDDLGDAFLDRKEGGLWIRREKIPGHGRKGDVWRRGRNRRLWRSEGCCSAGHAPEADLRRVQSPSSRFSDAMADEEGLPTLLGGNGPPPPPPPTHTIAPTSRCFSRTYRYEWSKGFDGRRPSGCSKYGCGTSPHVHRSTCGFTTWIFLGSLLRKTG